MMKRLFQFLPMLLIVALVGVFIYVKTFTQKASAAPSVQDACTITEEIGKPFKNPPFAYADKGLITLEATPGTIQLDRSYDGYLYKATYYDAEGNLVKDKRPQYTPPTIVVSPGNSIDLTLTNNLPINVQLKGQLPPTEENLQYQSQDTNLHYHGFNVSPLLGSDDVVMHVHSDKTPTPVIVSENDPTKKFTGEGTRDEVEINSKIESTENSYEFIPDSKLRLMPPTTGNIDSGNNLDDSIAEYRMQVDLPKGHQSGLFWYHPHAHTVTNNQVRAGMSGGIIVNGIEDSYRLLDPKYGIKVKGDSVSPSTRQPTRLAITQMVMLFKDFNNVLAPTDQMNCFTLNGQVKPKITIESGEVQLWRIGNTGADQYMNLAIETQNLKNPQFATNMPFYILARDGNLVKEPIETHSVLLPPGSRVELLVVGNTVNDKHKYNLVSDLSSPLTTKQQDWFNDPNQKKYYDLATVNVGNSKSVTYLCPDGSPLKFCLPDGSENIVDYITSQKPVQIDDILPNPDLLAKYDYCKDGNDRARCITPGTEYPDPLTQKRTFAFNSNDPEFTKFTINNKLYDENRIDKVSHLGDIEEWQVVNDDNAKAHAFHMHQLDFLVTKVTLPDNPGSSYDNYNIVGGKCNGEKPHYTCDLEPQGYRDVIHLPPNSTITIRIPFLNPFITGVFVYHCHLLDHEDKGMMQNLKVIDPKNYKSTF